MHPLLRVPSSSVRTLLFSPAKWDAQCCFQAQVRKWIGGKELSRLPSTSQQMTRTTLGKQRPTHRALLMVSGLFLQGNLKSMVLRCFRI